MSDKTENPKEIYLAGGCFWGVEAYLSSIHGVVRTQAGYANGRTENPTYEEVCHKNTGHAETVRVLYDPMKTDLQFLLGLYFESIDPVSVNRQGNDRGTQYRTGIYYVDKGDEAVIKDAIDTLQKKYEKPVAVEVKPLENFYPAEEYHQEYLKKNPGGYCHIHPETLEKARNARKSQNRYKPVPEETLKRNLSDLQYDVTQNNATEKPFQNEYFDVFEEGIYVDITTGEPLFLSRDKFESGCGWPSFSKPISDDLIEKRADRSLVRERTEVRSKHGDAHLGHVFDDGPKELGGLRYCINSASLRFIPKDKMAVGGYGEYLSLLKD